MTGDLTLDFETRSTVDLTKTGVYVYADDPTTDVWCCAYAFGDGEIKVWRRGDPCPPEIAAHVTSGGKIRAFNANFERIIWRHVMAPRYGWPEPDICQWYCTMAAGLAMALPGSLKQMGAALGLDTGKADEGHRHMLQMTKPRRPRKGEPPNALLWWDDDERLNRLCDICANDVRSERDVQKRILQLSQSEQELWWLDQTINDRGVYVDADLCNASLKVVETATDWLDDEMLHTTGGAVSRTTNVIQLMAWLRERGYQMASVDKEHLADALIRPDLPDDVRKALEIRQEAAKGAVKKIAALMAGRSKDGRARGMLQFHQASTGRWAGRRFQPQNLPRGSGADPEEIVDSLMTGNARLVRMLHDEPLRAVSDCLRGMVRAAPGKKLMVADFSNIEGRVIAWLTEEHWKVDAFKAFDAGRGHDIYKLAYSKSFNVRPEDVDKPQRQIGKVMELALGYQGGVGAFQKMAVGYGVKVSDDKADELKLAWREAHPNVVKFWYDLERGAKAAIVNRGQRVDVGMISFRCAGSFLFMRLPSSRVICYPYPCIAEKMTPWGEMRPQVSYKGVDSYTRKWTDCFAHGGLLFNNAVQGTARDIEAEAMKRLEAAGYWNVLNVHDEVVSEVDEGFGSTEEFEHIMTILPAWADGLPIKAEAWAGSRYRK